MAAVQEAHPVADMEDVGVGTVRQQVVNLVQEAIAATVPDVEGSIALKVTISEDPEKPREKPQEKQEKGDYQCNNAMGIWAKLKGQGGNYPFQNSKALGEALAANMPESSVITSVSVSGPGYVNISLSDRWIEKKVHQLLVHGIRSWAPVLPYKRAVVDFSSPNIAKKMHVGHLRSTIIGDCLSRILEFCGVKVLRRNHVGDWGTQFGMLIEFLFEQFPNWEEVGDQAVEDLQAFYKMAKVKFDDDPDFKAKAQRAVVLLQGDTDPKYRAAWTKICDVSRKSFQEIYNRLNVSLEEKGESFYNDYIPRVVQELEEKGLIEDSDGARVIKFPPSGDGLGFSSPVALMLVKRDGGFNYDTTDMTALWYRLNEEQAEVLIYVTDVGQSLHFQMVFEAGKRAGWLPRSDCELPQAKHVGFGLVLGEDGKKLRSRSSTENPLLVDHLDKAKEQCKKDLDDRLVESGREGEWSEQEKDETVEALSCGAVKYADLKTNRLTSYTFNYDKMLASVGNTAVYLLYAHARICSILRKSGKDMEEIKVHTGQLQLLHPKERKLALEVTRFGEFVEDAATDLVPKLLCDYLYSLSGKFSEFYTDCRIVGSEHENSRLLLCEATGVVMRECFHLLGIKPLYRL